MPADDIDSIFSSFDWRSKNLVKVVNLLILAAFGSLQAGKNVSLTPRSKAGRGNISSWDAK